MQELTEIRIMKINENIISSYQLSHNSPKWEPTQTSISKRIDIHIVVYSFIGIPLGSKNELLTNITLRERLDRKEYIWSDSLYIKFKNRKIYKVTSEVGQGEDLGRNDFHIDWGSYMGAYTD